MVEIFDDACDLPGDWDGITADNYALKRDFLIMTQKTNASEMKFYVFRTEQGVIDSGFVTFYTRRFNVFLYTPVTIRFDVTIIHVPLSITRPGYIIGDQTRDEVMETIKNLKGFVIILNADLNQLPAKGFAIGKISSRIRMQTPWKSFDEYIGSMRSHYRYRNNKAIRRGKDLRFYILEDNSTFCDELYQLYKDVYTKSRIRVEILGIDYFRSPQAKILICENSDKKLGFIQMIENGKELIFAFVGIDYNLNHHYDIYQNLLLKMVKYAIENGFTTLELGQTAEDAKLKLGGEYLPLYAYLRHSNRLMHLSISTIINAISYREPSLHFHVFKKDVSYNNRTSLKQIGAAL